MASESTTRRRVRQQGTVASVSGAKTIVVQVERRVKHPRKPHCLAETRFGNPIVCQPIRQVGARWAATRHARADRAKSTSIATAGSRDRRGILNPIPPRMIIG